MNAPQDNVAVAIVSRADVPGTRHTVERLTPPRPRRQGCSVERILELLDQGRFTATYKYAVPPAAAAAAGSACEPNGPRPHRPTSVGGARAVNIANNAVFSGRASER